MAKVTATGLFKGRHITVSCVEENDGKIHVYANGKEDFEVQLVMDLYIRYREERYSGTHAYSAPHNTIEAYWLTMHEGLFDKGPENIIVEGEIDTFGSPYSDEDTSDAVF